VLVAGLITQMQVAVVLVVYYRALFHRLLQELCILPQLAPVVQAEFMISLHRVEIIQPCLAQDYPL
jgi:hypothetical protein